MTDFVEKRPDFKPRDRSILQRVLDESDQVNKLNPEIATSCKAAIEKAPPGFCLAIGVGQKNEVWKSKGWHTLDISQETGAEYTMDANKMTERFKPDTLDALAVERITINPIGGLRPAVNNNDPSLSYDKLLSQARTLLKRGGKLIFIGADQGRYDLKYHFHSADFQKLFKKYGFLAVFEPDNKEEFLEDDMVGTKWYAQKV